MMMVNKVSSTDGSYDVVISNGIPISIHLANVNLPATNSANPSSNSSLSQNKTSLFSPTAVLFGWVGASLRQLQKYGALFNAMNYHVVYVIAPVWVVFALSPSTIKTFTLSILRVVATEANGQLMAGGVVWLFFSNGGAYCAEQMGQLFQQTDDKDRMEGIESEHNRFDNVNSHKEENKVKNENGLGDNDDIVVRRTRDSACGFIFDSAPCYPHSNAAGSALALALGVRRGSVQEYFVHRANAILEATRRFTIGDRASVFWNAMVHANFYCPELYIYSDSDRLVDVGKLNELIATRRKQGRPVHVLRLGGSSHVSILQTHPKHYTRAIRGVNMWGVNQWRARQNIPTWAIPEVESEVRAKL